MPLASALLTVAVLVAVAMIAGVVWRLRDGRRRRGRGTVDATALGLPAGRVAVVLFGTETCSRCPQVRRMLQNVASGHPDVEFVDVDLTHRPDIASRHRVLTTPTTFVVSAQGTVAARLVGVPQRAELTAALTEQPIPQEAS